MNSSQVLTDAFGRVREAVHAALEGVDPDHLTARPDDGTNTIAWLVWHLSRVQDDHLADAVGRPQVWTGDGWADRFGLPFEVAATGYGFGADDVAGVVVGVDLLLGYHDAVADAVEEAVRTLSDEDLDRVVDRRWDPPVTLGVRLVSMASDSLQHAGQAAFLRGMLERRAAG